MKTQQINIAQNLVHAEKTTAAAHPGWLERQANVFERGRFALMALFLTLQSCVGGIAAMYLLEKDTSDLYLMLCAAVTMGANALLIAQAGAKTCVIAIYVNVMINAALILAHL